MTGRTDHGAERRTAITSWKALVAQHQQPSALRATWQIVNTLLPYALLWGLMYVAVDISWWLALPLAALAGLFLIRSFIIFHDCCHGSFFASRRANDFWGALTGVLSLTPYMHWRSGHAAHHGAAGDLDRRGIGDVWTLTVDEYLSSSRMRRIAYRLARHPVFLFGLAPLFFFTVLMRFPRPKTNRVERRSVWRTNIGVLALVVGMSAVFGIWPYLLLQLVVTSVGGGIGIWLFYLQHQFEDAYWQRTRDWDYSAAALQGSSYLALPRVLQWFSGNIGFHHIHHLSPRIPNYNLERCHRSHELFRAVPAMTLASSFRSLNLRFWDESAGKLIDVRRLRELRRTRKPAA